MVLPEKMAKRFAYNDRKVTHSGLISCSIDDAQTKTVLLSQAIKVDVHEQPADENKSVCEVQNIGTIFTQWQPLNIDWQYPGQAEQPEG